MLAAAPVNILRSRPNSADQLAAQNGLLSHQMRRSSDNGAVVITTIAGPPTNKSSPTRSISPPERLHSTELENGLVVQQTQQQYQVRRVVVVLDLFA